MAETLRHLCAVYLYTHTMLFRSFVFVPPYGKYLLLSTEEPTIIANVLTAFLCMAKRLNGVILFFSSLGFFSLSGLLHHEVTNYWLNLIWRNGPEFIRNSSDDTEKKLAPVTGKKQKNMKLVYVDIKY